MLADAAADGREAALNLPLLLDRLDALLTGAAASVAVYDAARRRRRSWWCVG